MFTPTSSVISDAFPLIAGQTWERGDEPQDAPDSVHGGGHKPHELGVRERPVTQHSIIKVQSPGNETKTL